MSQARETGRVDVIRWAALVVVILAAGACGGAEVSPTTQVVVAPPTTSIVVTAEATASTTMPSTTTQVWTPAWVSVEYRSDAVDLGHPRFVFQSTAGSSIVAGIWYDVDNSYLIVGLDRRFYHYCGVPASTWNAFRSASSFGTFYNQSIRGNYDCRQGHVPRY